MESLTGQVHLEPRMRVLDMGCGKAISSIFLAKEFDVQVWATDLWISAGENWDRIKQAGVRDQVYPIDAEAHDLPFATGFFDAMVSVDAYHYFGTDDLYLDYYAGFARPGADVGIVVPGIAEEFAGEPPEHLRPLWPGEFYSFHSPAWWREHWRRSGQVEVRVADLIEDGWKDWLLWVGSEHEVGKAPRWIKGGTSDSRGWLGAPSKSRGREKAERRRGDPALRGAYPGRGVYLDGDPRHRRSTLVATRSCHRYRFRMRPP
jgi:SAM-dependent methyltransferase